nr:hypothetical protein CFP56_08081 [Quercus suber]
MHLRVHVSTSLCCSPHRSAGGFGSSMRKKGRKEGGQCAVDSRWEGKGRGRCAFLAGTQGDDWGGEGEGGTSLVEHVRHHLDLRLRGRDLLRRRGLWARAAAEEEGHSFWFLGGYFWLSGFRGSIDGGASEVAGVGFLAAGGFRRSLWLGVDEMVVGMGS